MGFFNAVMYERLSAMQKSVRRNLPEDAGYWFLALVDDGFFGAATNRLKITAHEDIGVLDFQRVQFALRCLDDAILYHKAGNDAWRMMVMNALILLCEAKKTRAGNHLQAVCRGRYLNDKAEGAIKDVPDWALDMHTAKGKHLKRGLEHFFDQGARLVPSHKDIWEDEAKKHWFSGILNEPKKPSGKPEKNGKKGSDESQQKLY